MDWRMGVSFNILFPVFVRKEKKKKKRNSIIIIYMRVESSYIFASIYTRITHLYMIIKII